MAHWKRCISTILLSTMLTTSYSFGSCSEILGKTKVKKAPASDIIQNIGLITFSVGTPFTTLGHVAQSGTTSASSAASAVVAVPGWIVMGTGVLLVVVGGIVQITKPDDDDMKSFKNLYSLFNDADALGDGPRMRAFINRIRREVKELSIDTSSVQFSDEVLEIFLDGDREQRWCEKNDNGDFFVMNIEAITKRITKDLNSKYKI